ncbi:MAG: hypothetical protein AAF432_16715 [Planctomycetota bacterium]
MTLRRSLLALCFIATTIGIAHDAHASRDPEHHGFRIKEPLQFSFTAGVYAPRLGDGVRFGDGASTRTLDIEDELFLNDRESTFNAELEIFNPEDNWEFFIGGFAFDAGTTGTFAGAAADFGAVQLNAGDTFSADIEITTLAADFSPLMWWAVQTEHTHFRFFPNVGVRWMNYEYEIAEVGVNSQTVDEDFIALYVGGGFELWHDFPDDFPILDQLEIDCIVTGGPAFGGDSSFLAQIRGGFTFHFNENFAAYVGYRLIEPDLEDGSFESDAGLQGMFIGGKLTF